MSKNKIISSSIAIISSFLIIILLLILLSNPNSSDSFDYYGIEKITDQDLERSKEIEMLSPQKINFLTTKDLQRRNRIFSRPVNNEDWKIINQIQENNYYRADQKVQDEFDQISNPSNPNSDFEQLKQEFRQTVVAESWRYPNGEIKPLYVDIDWDFLLKIFTNNNINKFSSTRFKQEILKHFNFLFYYYGKENILRLLFALTKINISQTVAITAQNDIFLTNDPYEEPYRNIRTYMAFSRRITNINSQYNSGYWSNNNPSAVIVHEYAHALDFFLNIRPDHRHLINQFGSSKLATQLVQSSIEKDPYLWEWNQKYNANNNHLICEENVNENQWFNSNDQLLEFLTKDHRPVDKQQKYLIAWSYVTSDYARTSPIHINDELFAESYSQFIGTPPKRRGKNWEKLAQFFTKILPTISKIKSL